MMNKLRNKLIQFFVTTLIPLSFFILAGCGGGSGSAGPSLSPTTQNQIDTLIQAFMATKGVTAGSITVMNGGNVLYDKSYGYQDSVSSVSIVNDPLMVTASIVKPLTAATVQNLASAGTLSLSDHVFCTGANAHCWLTVVDPAGTTLSGTTGPGAHFNGSGYSDITIQQLIDHEGGWDRTLQTCSNAAQYATIGGVANPTPCDPMIQEYLIQQTLHADFPANFTATQLPTQMNDIYYWVTQNALDHTPGTVQSYSNFGYMLLTAIVAKASNLATDYNTYIYNTMLSPLGISSSDFGTFTFSPSAGSAQALRTPYMSTAQPCPSIYPANNGQQVLGTAQGCLNPVNWVGAATTLATSKTMSKVASIFKIDNTNDFNSTVNPSLDGPNNGKLLNSTTNSGVHYGDLPGVTNILRQLTSGTSYTIMLNKDNQGGTWQSSLYPQIDTILSNGGY